MTGSGLVLAVGMGMGMGMEGYAMHFATPQFGQCTTGEWISPWPTGAPGGEGCVQSAHRVFAPVLPTHWRASAQPPGPRSTTIEARGGDFACRNRHGETDPWFISHKPCAVRVQTQP